MARAPKKRAAKKDSKPAASSGSAKSSSRNRDSQKSSAAKKTPTKKAAASKTASKAATAAKANTGAKGANKPSSKAAGKAENRRSKKQAEQVPAKRRERETESEEMLLVTEIVSAVNSGEATEALYERMTQLNELSPRNPAVLLAAAMMLGESEQELDELRYLELANDALDTIADKPLDRKGRMLLAMVLPLVRARLGAARWQAGDADGCLDLLKKMGEAEAEIPSKLGPEWICELAGLQIESGRWKEFGSLFHGQRSQLKDNPAIATYGLLAKFLADGDTPETRSAAKNVIEKYEERVAAVLNLNPPQIEDAPSDHDSPIDSDDVDDFDINPNELLRSFSKSFPGHPAAEGALPTEDEFDASLWSSWRRIPGALSWLRQQTVEVIVPQKSEVHGHTSAVLKELAKLPQADDTWQVDVQQLNAWFANGPQVTQPFATVVYSVAGSCVVAQQLTPDQPDTHRVFDVLAAGCRGLFGREPQRPTRILFRDSRLQAALNDPLTKLGITSAVDNGLNELAEFQRPMSDVWGGDANWPAVSETPDLTDAALKSFYTAAADAYGACVVPGDWMFGRTYRMLWVDELAQPEDDQLDIPGVGFLREGFVRLSCEKGMAPTIEMMISAVHFESDEDPDDVLADRLAAVEQSPDGFMLGSADDADHDAGCGEDCTEHDHDGDGTDITMQLEIVRENEDGEFDDDEGDEFDDEDEGGDDDSTDLGLLRVVYSEKYAIRRQDEVAMRRLGVPVSCETAYPILLADNVSDEPRFVTKQDVRDATVLLRGLCAAKEKFLNVGSESEVAGIQIAKIVLPDPEAGQSVKTGGKRTPRPSRDSQGAEIHLSVVQAPRLFELA